MKFAQYSLDVRGVPIDAVTSLTQREFFVRGIDEGRDPARDGVARDLLKQMVAAGASGEGEAPRVERKSGQHFADLITE